MDTRTIWRRRISAALSAVLVTVAVLTLKRTGAQPCDQGYRCGR